MFRPQMQQASTQSCITRGHLLLIYTVFIQASTLLLPVLALSSPIIAEPDPIAARGGDKCSGGSPQCCQTTYQNAQKLFTAQFSLKHILLSHAGELCIFAACLGKARCSAIATIMRRTLDVVVILVHIRMCRPHVPRLSMWPTPLSASFVGKHTWVLLFLSWIYLKCLS